MGRDRDGFPPAPNRLGCLVRVSDGAAECLSESPQRGSACTKNPILGCRLRVTAGARQCLCFCWPHPGTVGVASPSTYTQVGIGLGSIQRVGHPTLGTDISTSNYPRTPNSSPQGERIMQMSPM